MSKTAIYSQLCNLTSFYFEINPRSLLDDLIKYHLAVKPEKLSPSGLKALTPWLKIAVSLIHEDQKVVKKYLTAVEHLQSGGVHA